MVDFRRHFTSTFDVKISWCTVLWRFRCWCLKGWAIFTLEQVNRGWITPYLWATVSSFTHFPKNQILGKDISSYEIHISRACSFWMIFLLCDRWLDHLKHNLDDLFFCYMAKIFVPQGEFVCLFFHPPFQPDWTPNPTGLPCCLRSGRVVRSLKAWPERSWVSSSVVGISPIWWTKSGKNHQGWWEISHLLNRVLTFNHPRVVVWDFVHQQ